MIIIGIQRVDYISKKTNRPVKGYNFYVTESINEISGFGDKSEKIYVSETCVSDIPDIYSNDYIGCDVDFTYNKFGNVTGIILAD